MAASEDSSRRKAEELLLTHLSTIDAIIASIARRHHLLADETEELRSQVHLKLIDDDYAVLRKYRGDSSLSTYLGIVIQHFFLDGRVRAWGRFRPSFFARQSGPLGILFEGFIVRDRRTFDEACALVESRGIAFDRKTLRDYYERMQSRRRPIIGYAPLDENIQSPDTSEDALQENERTALANHTAQALRRAISRLAPRLRLIIQLRFEQGMRIADIARALSEDQKALYREFERLTSDLRAALEAEGLQGNAITELIGDSRVDFGDALRRDQPESSIVVSLKSVRAEQQGEHL